MHHHTRRPARAMLFPVVAAVLVMAGCGDGGGGEAASPQTSPPAAATPTATTPGTAASPTGSPTVITAAMHDFRIELSQNSFPPGTYTFVAEQEGQAPHALAINGPGVDNAQTPIIQPGGGSQQLTVTLQPGTYELWCPVGNHKERGMVLTVTTR
jgi:uncharacterized cupredoxin-like copper-binding protein